MVWDLPQHKRFREDEGKTRTFALCSNLVKESALFAAGPVMGV